ncbi:formin 2, putative [Plasmodium chabaudi chabaudi]|uniref:Formin 2, putative n=1 Tax=Plasmodium chabaudi chabaudi TaxID=31271 RepID=A0A1C6X7M1_PLACU|nr:formin 2, putative [Plasmodium chabaudi chabaudi]
MNSTFNDKKGSQINLLNTSETPAWSTDRISLSSEEYMYYVNLFNLNDKYENNYIDNKTASSFLQNSGLSIAVLHSIWEYSDIQNKGYLTLEDFFICCRLVAHAQNGNPLSSDLINTQPPCLPSFDIIRHKSFSNISIMEGTIEWKLGIAEKEDYKRIFKTLDINNEEKIEGNIIREYYLNTSNISICELMQIWNISDYDNDGYLDFDQFCIMNKIVDVRKGKEINIPLSIPKELLNSINPDYKLAMNDGTTFKRTDKGMETHESDKLSYVNLLKTENDDKEESKYENLEDIENAENSDNENNSEQEDNYENTDNEKLNMEFDFYEFKNEGSDDNSHYEKKIKKKKKNIAKSSIYKDKSEEFSDFQKEEEEEEEDDDDDNEVEEGEDEQGDIIQEVPNDEEHNNELLIVNNKKKKIKEKKKNNTNGTSKEKEKKKKKKKYDDKTMTYNEEPCGIEEMDVDQNQKHVKNKNEKKDDKMKKKIKQKDQGDENWKERWKEKMEEKIKAKLKEKMRVAMAEQVGGQINEKLSDIALENIPDNEIISKNKDNDSNESRSKLWKDLMSQSKLVKFNYANLKNANIESKDIYKIEELNKKLEAENTERKITIEKQKDQVNRLSYIYEHELKRHQCLKEERRNLEFLNICLYKDIKYKKENIKNIKKEIKELISDINKINIENLNINKNYIQKEKEVKAADQKRKELAEIISREKKYLKKDEKNLIMLKNMILYLRKQKSKALKLQDDLKSRYDVTNTDYQLLIKNVFHQQNNLNTIVNKRLDLEKVKNQQIVLFNSLSNQSILLDLKNKYPQLKKTLESQPSPTFPIQDNLLHDPSQNSQRKYFVDKKGIPNEPSQEIKSTKKNVKNFESMKNGDSVDIFSSLDEMDSIEDALGDENGSSNEMSLKDGSLKSDDNSP